MKKAFSLIELSIVILVIGILVAGVTQSSRLIAQMRLATARNLTQGSPVNSIKDVVFWLDSTAEASFASAESEDGLSINNWYDINQKDLTKKTFSASAAKPTYIARGISGLPAVNFNGSTQYFENAYDPDLNPATFTLIVAYIVDTIPVSSHAAAVSSRSVSSNLYGYTFYIRTASNNAYSFLYGTGASGWTDCASVVTNLTYSQPLVSSITHDGTNGKVYVNGTLGATSAGVFSPNSSTNFRIGAGTNEGTAGYHFDGKIGEIILFSRALKNEERYSIEKYLGQKWGAKIN